MEPCIVDLKYSYGRERIYPANPTAYLIIKLMERKCFTRDDLRIIQDLGFRVELKTPDLGLARDGKKGTKKR